MHTATLRQKMRRASMLTGGSAAFILAGVAPLMANAQQTANATASLVFDKVTVVDVEQGKLVPDQRVVVTGNRITAVGSASAVKMPNDAQVVDAKGKYLIPGLWDMHAHPDPASRFGLFHSLLIANGVTGARIPYLAMASVEEQVEWRKEVVAGTQVGPRQLLAGKPLNSFAADWEDTPEALQRGMDSLRALGLDFLKVYPLDPSTLRLAAAARRLHIPFGGHVVDLSAVEASDSGISIIDHLNAAGDLGEQCFPKSGGSLERCRTVAEAFRRNGTAFAPTLTVFANYHIENFLNASLPVFARMTTQASRFWADSLPAPGNWLRDPASVAVSRPSLAGPRPDTTGVLYLAQQVGLPIVSGTDIGPGNVRTMPAGFSLHAELAMSVAEGLTPLTALQSATINPVKVLHATDSLGTVAAGKLADLVLLDANPLEDITNTTTIRAVVANGRYFDRAALDRLLTSVQATAKADDEDP